MKERSWAKGGNLTQQIVNTPPPLFAKPPHTSVGLCPTCYGRNATCPTCHGIRNGRFVSTAVGWVRESEQPTPHPMGFITPTNTAKASEAGVEQ